MDFQIKEQIKYLNAAKMKEELTVHNFDLWQDPQCDPLIEIISDTLLYSFQCWDENRKKTQYIGTFVCDKVQAIRYSNPSEYFPFIDDHDFKCYYYEVQNSTWLTNLLALKDEKDSNWKVYDKSEYRHFILMTRDSFIEIISTSIILKKAKLKKSKLKLWKKYSY